MSAGSKASRQKPRKSSDTLTTTNEQESSKRASTLPRLPRTTPRNSTAEQLGRDGAEETPYTNVC